MMECFGEKQSIDCIRSNLSEALENINHLATKALRGAAYESLCDNLDIISDQCKVMNRYREDYHWLKLGNYMTDAREYCRRWLVGWTDKDGIRHEYNRENFLELAKILEDMRDKINELFTKATGVSGPILPTIQVAPRESGDCIVQVKTPYVKTKSGLLVPGEYSKWN